MAGALASGACAGLTTLDLRANGIGPEGAAALADAFGTGTCPRLGLQLPDLGYGNDIPAAAEQAVTAA
eukprot:SAG22_NODE_17251_length_308_cov_1.277512_1_plen_67_part_10